MVCTLLSTPSESIGESSDDEEGLAEEVARIRAKQKSLRPVDAPSSLSLTTSVHVTQQQDKVGLT